MGRYVQFAFLKDIFSYIQFKSHFTLGFCFIYVIESSLVNPKFDLCPSYQLLSKICVPAWPVSIKRLKTKKTLKLMQCTLYIHNTSVIYDLIKFTTHFWLFKANFKLCTIGSSMSVDHEGTVYSRRCYEKRKRKIVCVYWTFLVHLNV